jgi:ATP-dependent Clp protease protease subunit
MAGTKGKRYALPNSRIMIHQPSGGMTGTAADLDLQAKEILELKKICGNIIAEKTGQPFAKIMEETERDNYMNPEQAVEYGIIDKIAAKTPAETAPAA